MLPEIKLVADVDVVAMSPLVRGMVMAISYAETEGGIGLTASGAMNRKFVHWAAVHFDWPGNTPEDLYSVNKVLNEADMPPLSVVHDMLKHLRLVRRKKDRLLPTKRGRDFLARPQTFFDQIATDYLYAYIDYGQTRDDVRVRMRWWHVFLNLINIKARKGCSLDDLVSELYPRQSYSLAQAEMIIQATTIRGEFRYDIIRPLCWLGLLQEEREGLDFLQDGTYYKTPLWTACLELESDTEAEITVS
ncbi:MAG: hypothetical protein KK482_25625 [Sinorhizobium meliloti]|jgi:hypothetical protein|uniref:hypothetical protein n=1 Tax=Sinorhizobium TaxID=28105 RepID=UPI00036407C4|nr:MULTISPECIES: hypothetical protein [Sinorhizobium]MCG5487028.1 hypothetical protein [Sinorhizobium meliloti]PND19586.1 hypothetical protein CN934_21350 [Ensifer sp. MMN_5]PND24362.1 hypothetical protein CN933_26370 [Sinorhizobium sp. M4_45]